MVSIFALEKDEQRNFIKVPRSAQSKFCDLQNTYYVKCCIIERYSVVENIELCTMFCSDELRAEDLFDDESADHTSLPATATLRGNIMVTSYVHNVVGNNKLLLDIKKLYGSDFFDDAVQVLGRHVSGQATPEYLPCNQLYLLRKARELQSML